MIIMPKTKRIPKMVSTDLKSLDWYLFNIIGKENFIIIIIFILINLYREHSKRPSCHQENGLLEGGKLDADYRKHKWYSG
jgi:hypothetical protein